MVTILRIAHMDAQMRKMQTAAVDHKHTIDTSVHVARHVDAQKGKPPRTKALCHHPPTRTGLDGAMGCIFQISSVLPVAALNHHTFQQMHFLVIDSLDHMDDAASGRSSGHPPADGLVRTVQRAIPPVIIPSAR